MNKIFLAEFRKLIAEFRRLKSKEFIFLRKSAINPRNLREIKKS
jgi:hypothetical protein